MPAIQDILAAVAVVASLAFLAGRTRAMTLARIEGVPLTSLSVYYGWYCTLGSLLPTFLAGVIGWFLPISDTALGVALPVIAVVSAVVCVMQISPELHTQRRVEKLIKGMLLASGVVAILTTLGIVLSLIFETGQFFRSDRVSVLNFFFGTEWSAQTSASFGALPLFFGTFFVAGIAILVAAPIGLFSAIYLSEYASPRSRALIKPVLEVLAGIPTVVYGFFAILVVAPLVRQFGMALDDILRPLNGGETVIAAQPKSALAAGLVMGVMIIPFISSLSDDVLRTVPSKLKNGALGVGATRAEMMADIVLPVAFPGLMAALLLAISRAIGETMIVVMAAGERANLTVNPFEDITTVTVQIVALMTGDPEFDNPRTLSAFALGAVLFVLTLVFNAFSQWIVERQRKRYAGL
ncbi:phosphate ABC transporter permease subunit PstC [Ponticaulis sp.]|uniref:phosphate ABC transporter permease subunit PstC n=1 Tax=Ponticaulis sp. TaxID=2020902 RepID=UPI000B624CFD|nr:phosphate ABC transporter permease subunit PstC [Ponticaulis sp.]MAI90173.1 phosphate ABC transporter permease subunit PstC [Ponticaulis sp.]OUX99824.1 MAG: phosphate ABC transporter permease subunit PstC [Hyphomonadaceae bacterium TMED5]|tara:strand:+ start:136728 stop:137954 length:1227 start_codon:yes stop_codon:yes gene_type:complete